MLVKSFTDDLAWVVQRELVNGYFRNRVSAAQTPAQMILAMAQAMVEQEQKVLALANQQQVIAEEQVLIKAKVEAIEARSQEAEGELAEALVPTEDVPELTTRARLNRLLRDYCFQNSMDHRSAFNRLYLETRDRLHVDLKTRAKGKETPLDVAERLGLMDKLYALAYHLFGRKGRSESA